MTHEYQGEMSETVRAQMVYKLIEFSSAKTLPPRKFGFGRDYARWAKLVDTHLQGFDEIKLFDAVKATKGLQQKLQEEKLQIKEIFSYRAREREKRKKNATYWGKQQ